MSDDNLTNAADLTRTLTELRSFLTKFLDAIKVQLESRAKERNRLQEKLEQEPKNRARYESLLTGPMGGSDHEWAMSNVGGLHAGYWNVITDYSILAEKQCGLVFTLEADAARAAIREATSALRQRDPCWIPHAELLLRVAIDLLSSTYQAPKSIEDQRIRDYDAWFSSFVNAHPEWDGNKSSSVYREGFKAFRRERKERTGDDASAVNFRVSRSRKKSPLNAHRENYPKKKPSTSKGSKARHRK